MFDHDLPGKRLARTGDTRHAGSAFDDIPLTTPNTLQTQSTVFRIGRTGVAHVEDESVGQDGPAGYFDVGVTDARACHRDHGRTFGRLQGQGLPGCPVDAVAEGAVALIEIDRRHGCRRIVGHIPVGRGVGRDGYHGTRSVRHRPRVPVAANMPHRIVRREKNGGVIGREGNGRSGGQRAGHRIELVGSGTGQVQSGELGHAIDRVALQHLAESARAGDRENHQALVVPVRIADRVDRADLHGAQRRSGRADGRRHDRQNGGWLDGEGGDEVRRIAQGWSDRRTGAVKRVVRAPAVARRRHLHAGEEHIGAPAIAGRIIVSEEAPHRAVGLGKKRSGIRIRAAPHRRDARGVGIARDQRDLDIERAGRDWDVRRLTVDLVGRGPPRQRKFEKNPAAAVGQFETHVAGPINPPVPPAQGESLPDLQGVAQAAIGPRQFLVIGIHPPPPAPVVEEGPGPVAVTGRGVERPRTEARAAVRAIGPR